MKTKKMVFYLLAALMAGCVPVMSLHPLFTEKDLVFDEKLLGTWAEDPNDPDGYWEFERSAESQKAYKLILHEEKKTLGSFTAFLLKLDGQLFLDITPDKFPYQETTEAKAKWEFNGSFFAPLHMFMKVERISPILKMEIMQTDRIAELVKEDPNAIKCEILKDGDDGRIILTASTAQLQQFMKTHADDEELFGDPMELKRLKPTEPNEPNSTDPNQR